MFSRLFRPCSKGKALVLSLCLAMFANEPAACAYADSKVVIYHDKINNSHLMRKDDDNDGCFPVEIFLSPLCVNCTLQQSKIRGACIGALVADALTLGTHYEYDAVKIANFYGEIDEYYAPGQKTGGQTHGIGWGARNYHGGNGRFVSHGARAVAHMHNAHASHVRKHRGPPKKAGEQVGP